MAQQNVCRSFKLRFCKFTEHCRKVHVKEKCEDSKCKVKNCKLRHPKVCTFFRDYNFCKFGEFCIFKHLKHAQNDTVENLAIENQEILSKLKNVEEKLELLNKEEFNTKQIIEKLSLVEKKFEKIELLEQEVHSNSKALEGLVKKMEI